MQSAFHPRFMRIFALLSLILLVSAQIQPNTHSPSPSPQQRPLDVPLPLKNTRIQISGLPAQCEIATLHFQQRDRFLPGSQTLHRPVALIKGSLSEPESGVGYGVEFWLGPGMTPQLYAPKQVWLSCSSPKQIWQNQRPLQLKQAEVSLNLNQDFEPLRTGTDGLPPFEALPEAHTREILKHSTLCRQAAAPRFFEEQGGNYTLNFNGGAPVTIIGRKSWGAGPSIPTGRSWQPYPAQASVCSWFRRITVHHTHTALSITALQKYHQNQADPKADIAYHFYIPASGEIYEARPLGYIGSHSERDNGHNLGIVLNGDFSKNTPSPQQVSALRNLLSALRCPCGFSDGVWTHQQRKHLTFKGDPAHSTECPGQELAREVYGMAADLGYGPLTTLPFDSAQGTRTDSVQGTGTKTRATPPP